MVYGICMNPQLDLFSKPPVQSNVLNTEEISYKPIASLTNATTLEFLSLGNGDSYRDLSSIYIKVLLRLKKSSTENHTAAVAAEGANPAVAATGGGVVNNLLHALFTQCTVYLNGTAISLSDNNYAYRSYIETLLNYGIDASSTHLDSIGYYPDTPGAHDDFAKNDGLKKRKEVFGGNAVIELMGKLHCDMFNQGKFLLNNVDLRIVLSLQKPEFYCLEYDTDTSVAEILDATLFMDHLTIDPSILLAHEQVLNTKPALYQYKRVEVKSYTIGAQNSAISLDNFIVGRLPTFLLIGFVDNDSYVGKRSKSPFNFKNYSMNQFSLNINGKNLPAQPLTFDYEKVLPVSTRGYANVFKNSGIHYYNTGNLITKKAFDGGTFWLCFDLSNDKSGHSNCTNLLNQGTIRMDARFAKELPNTITCLVYAEYDATVQINKNRDIRIEY